MFGWHMTVVRNRHVHNALLIHSKTIYSLTKYDLASAKADFDRWPEQI
jgi:uncharacterized protein with HEPN domain